MYTFELNNAVSTGTRPYKDKSAFVKLCEISSALFYGKDLTPFGKDADSAVATLRSINTRAANNDTTARLEMNAIIEYILTPKLQKQMDVLGFLGQYHQIGMNEMPYIKAYSYEGIEARQQAQGGAVTFGGRTFERQGVQTILVSGGMAINYRELSAGNFDGSVAEEMDQVLVTIHNNATRYVLDTLDAALKACTGVKHYAEYSDLTSDAVLGMVKAMRPYGKVNILADYNVLAAINDFQGYKTVGETIVPQFDPEYVSEMEKAGLYGFFKGAALTEIPNPYDLTRPLADKTGFEKHLDTDKAYFLSNENSPLHIFQRGRLSSLTGNDVNTGDVVTRFDLEVGAAVAKGREYEIGMLKKSV